MRQIILGTTESPGSRRGVDMIGEKRLDILLLGDGNGRLRRASGPGQRPHVYSYYGPCILLRVHFACVIIFPVRVTYYEPEIFVVFHAQISATFWIVTLPKLLKAKLLPAYRLASKVIGL